MASVYPGSLDALSTVHADGVSEIIHASTMNDDADAINKIETELGTLPKGVYANVKTRLNTLEYAVFNTQTGSTYTLALTDASGFVVCTNGTACVVTVPLNATVAFLTGTIIVIRAGVTAGAISVVGAGGVTISNPYNSFALAAASAEAKLMKIGTDAWSFNGEVV